MTTKANATLLAHTDAQEVTRRALAKLPAPEAIGPYHRPVPHVDLLDVIEQTVKKQLGAKVTEEKYALRRDGAGLFGVMTLTYGETDELSAALGLRHANDMSMSLQLVAGMTVFVCDNMVLRGDMVVMRKRHTTHLALADEVAEGLVRLRPHFAALEEEVVAWKRRKLTDVEAKALLYDALKARVVPATLVPAVGEEYFNPTYREHKTGTAWALHNAFTQVLKRVPVAPRMAATQRLARFLGQAA